MNYYLGDACQNTFLLFDRLNSPLLEVEFLQQAHRQLLEEQRDDALIMYHPEFKKGAFYVRMAVLGVDGSLAEFCGNGSRVCAAFLFEKYSCCKTIFLCAKEGAYPIKNWGDGLFSIQLPRPNFALNRKFIRCSTEALGKFSYVDMLEPHLLLQENLSDGELFELGKRLNQNRELFPNGINVNAWHVVKKGHIFVKTYERGVQRLTKSCGTGSLACAAFYQSMGKVFVSTPGGNLEIFIKEGEAELKGPAFFE